MAPSRATEYEIIIIIIIFDFFFSIFPFHKIDKQSLCIILDTYTKYRFGDILKSANGHEVMNISCSKIMILFSAISTIFQSNNVKPQ